MTPQAEPMRVMLAGVGITPTDGQIELLDRYRLALWTWNERMNLTRHTTLAKFVERDVVDSQELSKLLDRGQRVLDVGTGGGVPGVILAILRPDLSISVCDSTQKKARAVEDIVRQLDLPIQVYANRVNEVLENSTFDTLVARGLAPLGKVLNWLAPYWEAFDRLLLIKGPSWVNERAEARHHGQMRGLELRKAATYQSPGTGAESAILSITREDVMD
jgi:16S rRNA (guanine527-N7)-methyltransferase